MKHEDSHPKALVYSKGLHDFQGENLVTELLFLPDAFVKSVTIEKWINAGDYYIYVLNVFGRSRFLQCLPGHTRYIKYKAYARYSSLLELHDEIQEILKPFTLSKTKSELPSFPSKKWLQNDDELATKRVAQLNAYFGELFEKFGTSLQFSERIIDRFSPVHIEISFIGWNKKGINQYLDILVNLQKHMKVEEVGTSFLPFIQCTVEKLPDYSTVLAEMFKATKTDQKIWRNKAPFDYYSGGHLYRIDIKHAHGKAQGERELSLQGPTVIFVDGGSEGVEAEIKRITMKIGKKKHIPRCFVIALVNCAGDEVAGSFKKFVKESQVIEVDLVTGNNVFKVLDELLGIYFSLKQQF